MLTLCLQISEKHPLKVKNFGIWLRYDSRSGTHNMYKEYRETSRVAAVEAMYADMAARHRARFRSIHVWIHPSRSANAKGRNADTLYRSSRLLSSRRPRTSSALISSSLSPRTSPSLSLTVSPRSAPRRSSARSALPLSLKWSHDCGWGWQVLHQVFTRKNGISCICSLREHEMNKLPSTGSAFVGILQRSRCLLCAPFRPGLRLETRRIVSHTIRRSRGHWRVTCTISTKASRLP